MTGPAIHESETQELNLTGRRMRWVVSPDTIASNRCSVCIIRVPPREKVRPAHSHPNGEEVIHIISGSGRVLVSGQVYGVREGSTVLFPQGAVHMLHNTSDEEMKVVCFFAPPTGLDNYKLYEDVDFPPSEEPSR